MNIPPLTKKQQQLVASNLKLAYDRAYKAIRSRFIHPEYEEDAIYASILGLCRAASGYNESIAQFSTYAVGGINLSIKLLKWSIIKKNEINLVLESITLAQNEASLLGCFGVHDDGFEKVDLNDEIEHLKHYITDREWEVLDLYYFDDMTSKEIGKIIGLCEERVNQIRRCALYAMRNNGKRLEVELKKREIELKSKGKRKPRRPRQRVTYEENKCISKLEGVRINMLVAIEPTELRQEGATSIMWRCRCDCGKECLVPSNRLNPESKAWTIFSCGCKRKPRVNKPRPHQNVDV